MKDGRDSATLILIENSHFNRTALYTFNKDQPPLKQFSEISKENIFQNLFNLNSCQKISCGGWCGAGQFLYAQLLIVRPPAPRIRRLLLTYLLLFHFSLALRLLSNWILTSRKTALMKMSSETDDSFGRAKKSVTLSIIVEHDWGGECWRKKQVELVIFSA